MGELLGYDYASMNHDRLYQASDQLWKHKDALESQLYHNECQLFGLEETITLFDLTNTFFEGEANGVEKAQRGRSKEKRTDCPLITLGLVLDGSGFPRRSQLFPGNVSEAGTLQMMLRQLHSQSGPIIIMDAGIATQANIDWLKENGYRYLVVSRKRQRRYDDEQAITVKETLGQKVRVQRVVTEHGEIELYCHSQARQHKEEAIIDRGSERLETALQNLHDGLSKKGTTKRYNKVLKRLGRLREKHARVAQHYEIHVVPDKEHNNATALQWKRKLKTSSQATHPGVYCLRTNIKDWDETTLWRTYTMLTDLESVFRSLKAELGLRPNYHQKEQRIEGHTFITLLAYHLVHVIRTQLKKKGLNDSWHTLRQKMQNQQRMTACFTRKDGRSWHIRKANRAEPHQKVIYDALGLKSEPGQTRKTLI
ncbi:MAG: IS1634 family transposase [bacterium]